MTERQQNWRGMNWIRQDKRLAIYLRDGMACAWCGHSVEQGARLQLDHLTPVSAGGTNEATNLVTSCARCNAARGDRPVEVWAEAVAEYLNHGVTAEEILAHVEDTRRRPLDRDEARRMIARRGSAARVLASRMR